MNIHVVESPLAVHDNLRRLSTIESSRNLSVLSLTLVTPSGRLSLTGRRTATSSDALAVSPRVIGERG